MADDMSDVVINHEVDLLLQRLAARGINPDCISQWLMFRAAFLYQEVAGTEEAVDLCMRVANSDEMPEH